MSLEITDYKILVFILNHKNVTKENLIKAISLTEKALDYRCNILKRPTEYYITPFGTKSYISGSNYIYEKNGYYELTDFGVKVAFDYQEKEQANFRAKIMWSICAPITVSFITTLITLSLKGLL